MAATTRPLSLFQPPSSSASHADTITLSPLRRPRPCSPLADPFRRSSSYSIDSSHFEPSSGSSKRHSILRSASFMAFGFKERGKDKDKERPRTSSDSDKDVAKASYTSAPRVGSKLRSATAPSDFPDVSSPATGIFNLPVPRSMKKKRSLASLLSPAAEASGSSSAIQPTRTKSSNAASSLSAAFATKSQRPRTADIERRKEEYRQLAYEHTKPTPQPRPRLTRKTSWSERRGIKVMPSPDVTYMQSYDPLVLENERYSNLLLRRLNSLDRPSFHDYGNRPPSAVLDVGCGSGQWLVEATSAWGQSIFTGFDLVDVLIPEVSNHKNISLTCGNFLQSPWPFPKQSFELVRMANLSLCIPYDKWDLVLSEAQRVLTINGRLELIDDQITFPYAPAPTDPSRTQSRSQSLVPNRRTIFFDDDEGTLEGSDDNHSYKTDSTLVSDRDSSPPSPSSQQEAALISDDDGTSIFVQAPSPPGNIYAPPIDDPDVSPFGSANTITASNSTFPDRVEKSRPSSWNLDAAACKDLETVFQGMLTDKYGIHTLPRDILPKKMKRVFGNGKRMRTYHVKLAPKDAVDLTVGVEMISEKSTMKVGQKLNEFTREWEGKIRSKKANKTHSPVLDRFTSDPFDSVLDIRASPVIDISAPTGFDGHVLDISTAPVVDVRVPDGINAKAAGRLGIIEEAPQLLSPIPEQVSPKAAHRLGIRAPNGPRNMEKTLPSVPQASDAAAIDDSDPECTPTLPTIPIIAEPTTDDAEREPTTPERISVKAATRLGISYSALGAATAASRRPLSSSSTLVSHASSSSAPYQSPGIIVWPDRFIPLPPTELEMHACKYVHTLLGCRPALANYIEGFTDEHGSRLESDEEFDQAIWDYECFRRRRFNWPVDIPNWDVDLDVDSTDSISKPRSSSETISPSHQLPADASDMPRYPLDQLTHVRSVRVYQAVKTSSNLMVSASSSTSLPVPRPPPPSTPRRA